jgi:hypothetical protein
MTDIETLTFTNNVGTARDRNPGYKEEILPYDEIDKPPYKGHKHSGECFPGHCPHCGGGNLRLYGTMHGGYSQEWQQGMPGPYRPIPDEAQHVDLFECVPCEVRFFIHYEDDPPEIPKP